MRCLVTGATGFVGSRLLARLASGGHELRALVLDPSAVHSLRDSGVEVHVGLPEGLDQSFADRLVDLDVVFHCDSFLDPKAPPEAFREVNVVGTRRLLEAAVLAGVPRLVYLSSQSVVWDGSDRVDTDEAVPYPDRHLDPYSASRAEAERLVLVTARAGRMETVAIRPGWTWGPGDTVILPLLVRRALQGAIPLVGDGEYQTAITYIDHLLDALLSAATAEGVSGKSYFVSDDDKLTQRAFIDLQLGALGIVPRYRYIPPVVARAAAAVVVAAAPLLGASLPLVRLVTGLAGTEFTHNTARARQDLAFDPAITLDEGLARLKEWVQSIGGTAVLAEMAEGALPEPADS